VQQPKALFSLKGIKKPMLVKMLRAISPTLITGTAAMRKDELRALLAHIVTGIKKRSGPSIGMQCLDLAFNALALGELRAIYTAAQINPPTVAHGAVRKLNYVHKLVRKTNWHDQAGPASPPSVVLATAAQVQCVIRDSVETLYDERCKLLDSDLEKCSREQAELTAEPPSVVLAKQETQLQRLIRDSVETFYDERCKLLDSNLEKRAGEQQAELTAEPPSVVLAKQEAQLQGLIRDSVETFYDERCKLLDSNLEKRTREQQAERTAEASCSVQDYAMKKDPSRER
jgi:hypothetical protein